MNAPTNLVATNITGGARLTWDDNSSNEYGFEIWADINGAGYNLIATTLPGVTTYDDMRLGNFNMKYKVRAKTGTTLSSYSAPVAAEAPLDFVITSTGDGSGVAAFNIMVSENATATIDGNGKFYSDAAGTLDESTTFLFTSGALRRRYIRVTSGVAHLRIKNVIIQWGEAVAGGGYPNDGWSTPWDSTNYPTISTDCSKMTHNICINVFGLNTIYGDISAQTGMIYLEIGDGTPTHLLAVSGATVTGDLTNFHSLTCLDVWDLTHFTGTVNAANHPVLTTIWLGGLSTFTLNVAGMNLLSNLTVTATCSIVVTGSVAGCTELSTLVEDIVNTMSGSVAGLTKLVTFELKKSTNITVPTVVASPKLSYINVDGIVLTSANINQILADVVANKDAAKVTALRTLYLVGAAGTGAPTGQGIIDKAALQIYHSPTPPGTADVWTIYTR